MHIVLSHALPDGPNCKALLTRPEFPALPHLHKLFTLLARSSVAYAKPTDLTPLHERLAHAHLQAVDGLLPLGALAAQAAGLDGSAAWGLLSFCHLQAQSDHVAMRDPDELAIGAQESEALVQAMRPYFLEDELHLHPYQPGQWLVGGELLRDASALPVPSALAASGLFGGDGKADPSTKLGDTDVLEAPPDLGGGGDRRLVRPVRPVCRVGTS